MAASDSAYPGAADTFTDKTASDYVNASDMNAVQDGLMAVQATIRYAVIEVTPPEMFCATDDAKYFHIPEGLNGWNLVSVHAYTPTPGTTGTMSVMVYNQTDSQNMLSTALTIDSGENGSDTAATPAVIDTAHDDIATNDAIKVIITGIHTTPAQGLVVTCGFQVA